MIKFENTQVMGWGGCDPWDAESEEFLGEE